MQGSHPRDREFEEVFQKLILVELETERKQSNQFQRYRKDLVVITIQSFAIPWC